MTSNKEPEKAKFHGENLLYVKSGNKGWGGGGYEGQWIWTTHPPPPPLPWKDLTHDCNGSILITLPGIKWLAVL